MADVATWGQNYLTNIQAPVAMAQDIANARQRNALMAQEEMLRREDQNYLTQSRNALASGDANQIAQFDPRAAMDMQDFGARQNLQAWERAGTVARQIKASANPVALAGAWLQSPEAAETLKGIGMDPALFDLEGASPEDVTQVVDFIEQESARNLGASEFGAIGDKNLPSSVREDLYWSSLSPEQQRSWMERERARQITTVAGVPTDTTFRGGEVPLSSLPQEAGAAATIAGAEKSAEAEAASDVVPAKDRAAAAAKLPRAQAALRNLDDIRGALDDMGDNSVLKGGKFQSGLLSFTSEGQKLEQARAAFLSNITALTRIPGVGAQSDFEQRLQEMPLPDARYRPEVNEQAFKEMQLLTDDVNAALEALAAGNVPGYDANGNPASGVQQPQAAPAPTDDNDPLGIR